jgi:exodeoxyribonuclease VII small subunit
MAKKKTKTSGKEPSFEEALKRLEEIVSELESGDPALERALELFEEGVGLGRRCNAQLDQAEKTITVLVERSDGRLEEEAFEGEASGEGEGDDDGGGGDAEADDADIPF